VNFAGVAGAGLGLRRELISALKTCIPPSIDFFEIAPENWIDLGGAASRDLCSFTERYPFVCHGLSLSIGSPAPLDEELLLKIRHFLDQHRISLYTEHLSYCSDDGHLYDLLPIPFTEEAVKYVAARIRRVQDILERRIAMENASFYLQSPIAEMSEADFIRAVLAESDCNLHLDVNNVYVNSINHGYDALDFIRSMPSQRIVYMHMAGHYNESENLIIDTHGADVIDPVWSLLDETYRIHGIAPTLLERDFNIPPLAQLMLEVERIAAIQQQHANEGQARYAQRAS
jgi:uncharacterized protein (UPF0276 family)